MGYPTQQRTKVRSKHQREVGVNGIKTMWEREREGVSEELFLTTKAMMTP